MPKNRVLIQGGSIVSMDPAIGELVGDILIEGDSIRAIQPKIAVDASAAEVIDATGQIVLPGFIDTHRHLYQALLRGVGSDWSLFQYCVAMFTKLGFHFTPGDMYLANKLGALDALDSGVTTVFDWSHNQLTPDHTDELIRGLRQSGIRAQFGYGGSMRQWAEALMPPAFKSSTLTDAAEVRRLRQGPFSSDMGLLTLGLAARGPDIAAMDVCEDDWRLARELGIRINIHIGQGIFGGRPAVVALHKAGLLGDDLTFGHCNLLTDEEIQLMADHGVTAVTTPEDECNMGHGWPPIVRLLKHGIRPNIGIDTCIAVGGDQFSAMRFALGVSRAKGNGVQLDAGQNPWDLELTARDVLAMATIEGARALGQDDRIGSLTPGKQADVVLIETRDVAMSPVIDPVAAVVHHASRRNVADVFVAGQRAKRAGRLAAGNLAAFCEAATTSAFAILDRAGVKARWSPEFPG